ncbi:kinase-like protein [Polychytrium aggregatum]|uniref:kinase-like protein n=1 Tax=Polychytrium aggregatum TaxID=110093 RepID=UPI0022FE0E36|nr:kinase-like protein [Polychytrium aggregatum]KAI9208557.1 kinase-like protein [Polychytrium aggregatum]
MGCPATRQALKTPVQQSCDDKDGHYIVKPNDILASQYRIIRLLGQGTFGKVVEATDGEGKKYAIKIIRSTPKYREASRVEVRVLEHIKREDPTNSMQCIQLRKFFEYKHHSCMVFDLLSQSVFDFLKDNHFNPFPPEHIFRFTKQIVTAVAFLHRNELVHTDLKPENIMLNDNSYTLSTTDIGVGLKPKKLLKNATIQLIDFGSAVFEREYHSTVVSTRHYRAPEVILNLGWSYPCDMWSVGCILVEFWTGDALFQTHDNLEHLAMMEQVLGRFPLSMIEKSSVFQKYFNADGSVSHPKEDTTKTSINNVRRMKRISDIIKVKRNDDFAFRFLDLVSRMLTPDPKERITAQDALHHSFFSLYPGC